MRSIGDYVTAAGGRPAGFDYMRLILAVCVLALHAYSLSEGQDVARLLWMTFPMGGLMSLVLPMFFALSGFLVAGSMMRSGSVFTFMGLRFIRIYPALAVDVLLTALLIGPIVTSYSLSEYFSHPMFLHYLSNVTGHDITFTLPGAFENQPDTAANKQLWTVPFELYCYIALGLLMLFGARRDRRIVLFGTVVIFLLGLTMTGVRTDWAFGDWHGAVAGWMLVIAFLLGVNVYLWQDEIPCSPPIVVVTFVLSVLLFSFGPFDRIAGVFPASLLTVYLGVMNPKRIRLIAGADYSYGIFLYHYVIQQTLIHFAGGDLAWYWTLILSLPLAALFAAFSWTVVEKPALRLKAFLPRIERLALRPWRTRAGASGT